MDKINYQLVLDGLGKMQVELQEDIERFKTLLDEKTRQMGNIERAIVDVKALRDVGFSTITESAVSNENNIVRADETSSNSFGKNQDGILARMDYGVKSQRPITLNDGCEQILTRAGKALHADDLVEQLAALGRVTHKRSLNSTLIQDSKKRFVLLGENVFDLRSRQPQALFPELRVDLTPARKAARPKRKGGFVLTNAIRDVVKELNGRTFSGAQMFENLKIKFPNDVNEKRRSSVNSTLNNLITQGELDKVQVGTFETSAVYRAKQFNNTEENKNEVVAQTTASPFSPHNTGGNI